MNAMEIIAKIIFQLLFFKGWNVKLDGDVVYINFKEKEYIKIKVTLEEREA